ncbi:D-2-hydroxyglutarate dehydrogenase [plant metagenome]|uniref:D-2-hydroxyglutarate dehydrogenase n=1 Tax=plant metagenome TaxID=1297885 RepID=A0A484QKW1_9ZZZZ
MTALQGLLGPDHVLTGDDAEPYLLDWRGRYRGEALAVACPGSVDEVAGVVAECARLGVPIVPQGGNTGLCGGGTPDGSGTALIVSLRRLNAIREIDVENDTITVEAGCVLQAVQDAARAAGRLFALSLAAEGSCTVGGNLATNAGGTQVLRYGNARDLALGLEVVTPQGERWDGLRGLRKDNSGYSLRDLYIGSEGTLGIITAATFKLFPLPVAQSTALIALPSLEAAVALLARARAGFGPALTGFEVMAADVLGQVFTVFPEQRLPFDGEGAGAAWHALLEVSDSESAEHAQARFESVLGDALAAGNALDVVIAHSDAQSQALWHLRESIPLAEARLGKSIKHDVSLPASRIADFVRDTNALLQARYPGVRNVVFGHLGDGNLHYNVARAPGQSEAALLALQPEVYRLVHDSVHAHAGSISAEHGVGQLKRDELTRYKGAVELALMKRIKAALDPQGIMNPGKVLQS